MHEKSLINTQTPYQMQEDTWERAVGKDCPISLNGAVFIALALCLWVAYSLLKAFGEEYQKAEKKKELKERRDHAVQVEAMRLERERLRSRKSKREARDEA